MRRIILALIFFFPFELLAQPVGSRPLNSSIDSVTAVLNEPISIDDNSSSLTVDGSLTCNAGTNLNTSALALESGNIADIESNLTLITGTDGSAATTRGVPILGQDGTNFQQLSTDSNGRLNTIVASSALPSGAATSTLQVTGNTSLQTLDNVIFVDDAAFTPATSSVSMCGFEFDNTTPDSVDEGDAGAARMSANRNQYIQIRDGAGNERGANVNASSQLSVSVDNTPTVDIIDGEIVYVINTDDTKICSEETLANVDANLSTLLQLLRIDDAGFTVAGSYVAPVGFMFDDVLPDSVNEGDIGAARMSANRNQYMQIRDAAGNERGANVDSSNRLTTTTEGNTAEGGALGNPVTAAFKDVFTGLKSVPVVFENAGIDFLLSTPVDIGLNFPDYSATGEGASWVAATANTIATARYMTVDSSGNLQVIGSIAHDAADSTPPIKIGSRARTSHITAVANDDRVDQISNVLGYSGVTLAHNNRSDTFTGTGNGTTIGDGFQTFKYFSIQVKGTGAGATAWTANLQCSLDNTNFSTVVSHGTADVDGTVKAFSTPFPCLYFRTNVSALTLGGATNIVVTILGVQ